MTNIHTADDLIQLQSLPLEQKILLTQKRVREWYEHYQGQVYVSFSGGKDSTVLKHIVESIYDDVPSVYVDTGLEYPEVRQFAMSQPNVTTVKPEKTFKQVIEEYGYPIVSKEVAQCVREAKIGLERNDGSYAFRIAELRGDRRNKNGELSKFNLKKWGFLLDAPFRISEKCCNEMKKKPAKKYERETGRKPIIGTMAEESRMRWQRWVRHGCNAYSDNRPVSNPISFWTEQDVLEYLRRYNLPYASVYGEIMEEEGKLQTTGCTRTGCVFCGFGCHLEKGENRFQRLKHTHPQLWSYCMDKLGMREVLAYINVPIE